jgi:hypothetical protein
MSLVGVVTAVTSSIVGAVVSTVKEVIVRELFKSNFWLVTVMVQSEYVPSLNEAKVIVLFPLIAEVVLEEHEPPYEFTPSIVEEKV